MEQIKGKYRVTYKKPMYEIDRRNRIVVSKISTFEGVCENFTTHLSAFLNDQNELLLVDYHDIVQLVPIKE